MTMSEPQKRRLASLEARLEAQEAALRATRERWAVLVEGVGQAPAARELGISRQAVHDRLKSIRRGRAK